MGFYCITTTNADFRPLFVENIEKARKEQVGKLGQHHCPATFFEKKLADAYVEELPCIWIDVDVPENYNSFEDAVKEWSIVIDKNKFTQPSLWVSSGSGLHLYWYFTEKRKTQDWIVLRDALVRFFIDNNLKADYAHTHPSAYMRTIGSINEKTNTKVSPVKVNEKVSFIEMMAKLADYVAGGKKSGVAPTQNKPFLTKTPSWDLIKERCDALRFASEPENQPNVSEALWRALLSNVYVCENGDQLIHEVSKYHPNYNNMQTEAKARKSIPYTCKKIKECGGACSQCKNIVKSPISLGYIKEENNENEKSLIKKVDKEVIVIGKYTLTKEGITCPSKDMEEVIHVTGTPIYIGNVVENTIGDAVSGCYLRWTNSNGEERSEFIDYSSLCNQPDCIKWLANRNLMNKIYSLKDFVNYVLTATSMIEKGNLKSGASRYGWMGEDLIMPYGKVTKDGIEEAYIIGDLPKNTIKPTGNQKGCLETVFDYLISKNNGMLVAPMLLNLVAPLFPIVGINPVVFYLSGMSGSGKSTVGFAGMCLYGFKDKFNMVEGSTTMNSIMDKMSSLNCLTLTVDEVSLARRNDMREIIMQAVNGRPKGRLTKNAKQNVKDEWWTPLIVTSNPSYSEGNDYIDVAQGVRMVEFSMFETLKIKNEDIMRMKNELVEDGANIAFYIVQNKEVLSKGIQECLTRITDDERYEASMRFLAATWAVMQAGVKILHDLYPSIFQKILYILPKLEHKIVWSKIPLQSDEIITNAVNNWINNNNEKISIWGEYGCINEDKIRVACARFNKDENIMYIKRTTFREILQDCGESTEAFKRWAKEHCNANGDCTRTRLLRKSSPVYVYGYRMDKGNEENNNEI